MRPVGVSADNQPVRMPEVDHLALDARVGGVESMVKCHRPEAEAVLSTVDVGDVLPSSGSADVLPVVEHAG
jgi:hypothetical protein